VLLGLGDLLRLLAKSCLASALKLPIGAVMFLPSGTQISIPPALM
jgi:hypothetical protein